MLAGRQRTFHFPENISFNYIGQLYNQLQTILSEESVVFDLTKTSYVHSAFVGFLICVKSELDKNGGSVTLITSPAIKNLLYSLKLEGFFDLERRSA